MTGHDRTVILLDVDNTLIDNDRFGRDLSERLEKAFGAAQRDRYFAIYARLREERGYADYLAALQELSIGLEDDADLLWLSGFMLDYPFADRVYPHALDAIAHLHTLGLPVILSDGDVVFQPRKVHRSGIWDAVRGNVLIYLHKETMLQSMQDRFPARHYVMVDDKPKLLSAMKRVMGNRLTTVFVRQGHYAVEAEGIIFDPAPDRTIECIADLLQFDASDVVA